MDMAKMRARARRVRGRVRDGGGCEAGRGGPARPAPRGFVRGAGVVRAGTPSGGRRVEKDGGY
ncbi:hypothetical protein GCM10027073_40390 [Streptomyces chlorus]